MNPVGAVDAPVVLEFDSYESTTDPDKSEDDNTPRQPRTSTVIDLRAMKEGTLKRKLKTMDVNSDNQISLTEVITAVREKMATEVDLKKTRQLVVLLAIAIIIIVAATAGLTYLVVHNSISMKPDISDPSNPLLTAAGSGNPMQVFAQVSSVNVPLGAFHLLPNLLYNLNQIAFHEPSNNNPAKEMLHVLYVQSILQHPSDNYFTINCNDGTVVEVRGYLNATVIRKDGTSFPMCAACSSCVFQSTPETPEVKRALDQFNIAVPDINTACTPIWISSVPPHRRREIGTAVITNQQEFCLTCREAVVINTEAAMLNNKLANMDLCSGSSVGDFSNIDTNTEYFDTNVTTCDVACKELGFVVRTDLSWYGTCEFDKCICKGNSKSRRAAGCVSCPTGYYSGLSGCTAYTTSCGVGQYWKNYVNASSADRTCATCASSCSAGTGVNGLNGTNCSATADAVCTACSGNTFNTGNLLQCSVCPSSCPEGFTGGSCSKTLGYTCPIAVTTCSTTSDPGMIGLCTVVQNPEKLLIPNVLAATIQGLSGGVTVGVQFQFPQPCASNAYACRFVTKYFGSPTITSTLGLTLDPALVFTTSLNDIYLTYDRFGRPTLSLSSIGYLFSMMIPEPSRNPVFNITQEYHVAMTVETGKDSQQTVVYTPGQPYSFINPLTFQVTVGFIVEAEEVSLQLTGQVIGVMRRAFGLRWLNFANFGLSATFSLQAAGWPTALAFAGSLYIGDRCFVPAVAGVAGNYVLNPEGPCVGGSFAAGLDLLNPYESFYMSTALYGLTVSNILTVLGYENLRDKLPKLLLGCGFPAQFDDDGMPLPNPTMSVNLSPDEVTALDGSSIPPGLFYGGVVNVWGYEVAAAITFVPDEPLATFLVALPAFNITMPPCSQRNILGCGEVLLSVKRADLGAPFDIPGDGPVIEANIDLESDPLGSYLRASGEIGLLGASISGALVITPTSFSLEAQLHVFTYFEAFVRLTADVVIDTSVPFQFENFNTPISIYLNFSGSAIATFTKEINKMIAFVADATDKVVSGFADNMNLASDAVNSAASAVQKADDDCKSAADNTDLVVQKYQAEVDRVNGLVNDANETARYFNGLLADANQAKEDAISALNSIPEPCRIKSCNDVRCCPHLCRCRWRKWKLRCDTCYDSIPDIGCEIENGLCSPLRETYEGLLFAAKSVVKTAMDAYKDALKDARAATNALQDLVTNVLTVATDKLAWAMNNIDEALAELCDGVIGIAKDALNTANGVLKDAQAALNSVADAVSVGSSLGSKGLTVYSMSLFSQLNVIHMSDGAIILSVVASILGNDPRTYTISMHMGNLYTSAINFVKSQVPRFSEFLSNVQDLVEKVCQFAPRAVCNFINNFLDEFKICSTQCPQATGSNGVNGVSCSDHDDRKCGSCVSGTFNDGSSLTCQNCSSFTCPAGTGLNGFGGRACTNVSDMQCGTCFPGTYNTGNSNTCNTYTSSCPPTTSYWSNAVNATTANKQCSVFAVPCAPGTYWSNNGDNITNDRLCVPCATGKFSSTANTTSCVSYNVTCAGGSYWNNFYFAASAERSCTPCSVFCPIGTGLNGVGARLCTATSDRICGGCNKDIGFHNNSAQRTCIPFVANCRSGFFWNNTASANTSDRTCGPCPSTPCPAGTGTNGINGNQCAPLTSRTCGSCPKGTFNNGSFQECSLYSVACQAGARWSNFLNAATADRICTLCASTTYSVPFSQLQEIATGNPVEASSTYLGNGGATMGNDNILSTSWMSQDNTPVNWWIVDLLDMYTIASVKINNRADGYFDSISGVSILIGTFWDRSLSGFLASSTACNPAVTVVGVNGNISITCAANLVGRYVMIYKNGYLLTFADIQVYSDVAVSDVTSCTNKRTCAVSTYMLSGGSTTSDRICKDCLIGKESTAVNSNTGCSVTNAACRANLNGYVCSSPVENGRRCQRDSDCISGLCEGTKCSAKFPTVTATSFVTTGDVTNPRGWDRVVTVQVSSSSTYSGSESWLLFDNQLRNVAGANDTWISNTCYNGATGLYSTTQCSGTATAKFETQVGDWIRVYVGQPIVLQTFKLYGRVDITGLYRNRPLKFSIYGSNDNSTWSLIKNQSSAITYTSSVYSGPQLYASNSRGVSYSWFALVIIAIENSTAVFTAANLVEWELYGYEICAPGQYMADLFMNDINFPSMSCATCPTNINPFAFTSVWNNNATCSTLPFISPCGVGTYWSNYADFRISSNKTCLPCPAGTFASTTDAEFCSPYSAQCTPGYYWSNSAGKTSSDRVCVPCASNTYTPTTLNSTAVWPPVEFYSYSGTFVDGVTGLLLLSNVKYGNGQYACSASRVSPTQNCFAAFMNSDQSNPAFGTPRQWQIDNLDSPLTTNVSGTVTYGDWIQISLPVAIAMNAYSFKTRGVSYPSSWVLAGSTGGAAPWNLLDSQSFSVLLGQNVTVAFSIPLSAQTAKYSSFRFIYVDATGSNRSVLTLANLKFYSVLGAYAVTNQSTSCTSIPTCPSGTISVNNDKFLYHIASKYCASGCVNGFAINNATACTPYLVSCGPGTFWNNSVVNATAERTCAACSTGTFSSGSNSRACTSYSTTCPTGTFWDNFGQAPRADRTCRNCSIGTYANDTNQVSCQFKQVTCLPGSFVTNPGFVNERICGACGSGSFTDNINLNGCRALQMCPPGTVWSNVAVTTSADRTCGPCAPGTYSTTNNTKLSCTVYGTECQPGTYSSNLSTTQDRVCFTCPSKTFSAFAYPLYFPPPNVLALQNKSSFNLTNGGNFGSGVYSCYASSDLTEYNSCFAAYSARTLIDGPTCTSDGLGCAYWSNGPLPTSQQALPATNISTVNTTVFGYWLDIVLPVQITLSNYSFFGTPDSNPTSWLILGSTDRSKWYLLDNRTLSAPAAPFTENFFSVSTSANYTSFRFVYRNSSGPFANLTGLHYYSSANATAPLPPNAQSCTAVRNCPPGTFRNASDDNVRTRDRVCTPCPAGKYANITNATSCVNAVICTPGTYWANSVNTSTANRNCVRCPSNQFSAANNSVNCSVQTSCSTGMFVNNLAAAASRTTDRLCTSCTSGKFSPTVNAGSCTNQTTNCAAGFFWFNHLNNLTRPRVCQWCQPGIFFSNTTNALQCSVLRVCNASQGEYASSNYPGTSISDRVCNICAGYLGSSGPRWASVVSTPPQCNAYSKSCALGKYWSNYNNRYSEERNCLTCGAGKYSAATNSAVCSSFTQCTVGQYISVNGTSTNNRACLACPAGTSSSTTNAVKCV